MIDRAIAVLALGVIACSGRASTTPGPPPPRPLAAGSADLLGPEAFAAIQDRELRSQALFLEASRVLLHPRCVNCHPPDDNPRQGMTAMLHDPPVVRGAADRGVPGLQCTGCHQDRNAELARVPGAPDWHLAPREMVWLGRTPRQICEQLKDTRRNGGKTLAQIQEHMAHDKLVGWGWAPGADREPAPGSQAQLGALVQAWIETGAVCPSEEVAR